MIKIYFHSNQECKYVHQLLMEREENIQLRWKKNIHWGNELQILSYVSMRTLVFVFVDTIITLRLNKMIENVARQTYFYEKATDIEYITEWANEVIHDPIFLQNELNSASLHDFLFFHLFAQLKDLFTFHFDSLVTFSLKPLHEALIHIVGFAIDEIKREEEHQHFLHGIREFIHYRNPKCEQLHILQKEPFQFYREDGRKYTAEELKQMMIHEPLYIVGLNETESTLAPVITILPKKINIYGDDPTERRTVTLMNIFQERLQFLPIEHFPFPSHMKKDM